MLEKAITNAALHDGKWPRLAQPFATSCTLPTRGENDLLQSFAFLQPSKLKHFILTILNARVTVETESRRFCQDRSSTDAPAFKVVKQHQGELLLCASVKFEIKPLQQSSRKKQQVLT